MYRRTAHPDNEGSQVRLALTIETMMRLLIGRGNKNETKIAIKLDRFQTASMGIEIHIYDFR